MEVRREALELNAGEPDSHDDGNSFNGIQTFPEHSSFGMNGRTLYGRIAYSF